MAGLQEGFVSQVLFYCSPVPRAGRVGPALQTGSVGLLFSDPVSVCPSRGMSWAAQLWLYFGAGPDLPHSQKICAKTADKAVSGFQLPKANRLGETCGKV